MATINSNEKVLEATCEQELAAIIDSLEVLGGKWKLRIIRHLNNHSSEINTFKKMRNYPFKNSLVIQTPFSISQSIPLIH